MSRDNYRPRLAPSCFLHAASVVGFALAVAAPALADSGVLLLPGHGGGIDSQDVLHAELALQQLGYDVGIPDGLLSEQTATGLRAWQHDFGLAPTGQVDRVALAQLDEALDRGAPARRAPTTPRPSRLPAMVANTVDKIEDAIPSPAVPPLAVSGQTQTAPFDAQVGEAQRRLTSLGYAIGPIDGRSSFLLADAARRFQQEQGVPVTGSITPSLLRDLEIAESRTHERRDAPPD